MPKHSTCQAATRGNDAFFHRRPGYHPGFRIGGFESDDGGKASHAAEPVTLAPGLVGILLSGPAYDVDFRIHSSYCHRAGAQDLRLAQSIPYRRL